MRVRVRYPLEHGRLVVRSDEDWERDVEPEQADAQSSTFTFDLGEGRPFRYFKPLLCEGEERVWAQGTNALALAEGEPEPVYPYFRPDASCHVCEAHAVPSRFLERGHDVRVFLPPGYEENALERFPVLYMQDGQNLFFPDEAFGGKHWRVPETLGVLDAMSLVRQVIVVGVYPRDRMEDYTRPGYDAYARFLARELKPWVDERYRTLPGPRHAALLGSSLGGVVSLHAALSHPRAFGNAGCMSSTFGYRDDLLERVLSGRRQPVRVYLDTGWPQDNYEVTRSMREALVRAGWREGSDLRYLAFPQARHDEQSWAERAHLPLQFFFGR